MRGFFFLSLVLATTASRVSVESISRQAEVIDAEVIDAEVIDAEVIDAVPESLVEVSESTDTTSRRRAPGPGRRPLPRPAPRPAPAPYRPAPAPAGGSRRRGGPPAGVMQHTNELGWHPAPAPAPAPAGGSRRRGGPPAGVMQHSDELGWHPAPAPAPAGGTPPTPVPPHRRRQPQHRRRQTPQADVRRRVADFRRRDSTRRRINYNDQVVDHTRRRSDMRRRSSDGWLEGSHRRRGVFPTGFEMGALGFAAGIAIGYSVTGAGGHQYYYHNIGWIDSFGVYHAPGYYSGDGYYWATGADIGYSTSFGRWGSVTNEVETLSNLMDLNRDGVVSRDELRYGLEMEFLQVGPGANMYLEMAGGQVYMPR